MVKGSRTTSHKGNVARATHTAHTKSVCKGLVWATGVVAEALADNFAWLTPNLDSQDALASVIRDFEIYNDAPIVFASAFSGRTGEVRGAAALAGQIRVFPCRFPF